MKMKIKDAIILASVKYGYPLDHNDTLSGSRKKHGRMSGKSGLHGGEFYDKWDKIHGVTRNQ